MKDLLRQGKAFVIESALHLFVMLFGLGLVIATFLDKTFPPQQMLVWQAFGLTIAGTGMMRLIDLWWGMDSTKKILDELAKQQAEIQALHAEMTRLSNLLEQRLETPVLAEPAQQNGHQHEVQPETRLQS